MISLHQAQKTRHSSLHVDCGWQETLAAFTMTAPNHAGTTADTALTAAWVCLLVRSGIVNVGRLPATLQDYSRYGKWVT